MASTIEGIEKNLEAYEIDLSRSEEWTLKQLRTKFKSEQTEIWAAAAIKLGDLMAVMPEAREFVLNQMVARDNIHAVRHAHTAFLRYAAQLKMLNQKETIEVLDSYAGGLKTANIIKVDAVDYVSAMLSNLEISGLREAVNLWGGEQLFNVHPKVISDICRKKAPLDLLREKIKNEEKKLEQVPEKHREGKKKALDRLRDLKAEQMTIETFSKKIGFPIIKPPRMEINEWILNTMVFSFNALFSAFTKHDFFWITAGLVSKGETQISLVKNLPYFFCTVSDRRFPDKTILADLLEKRIRDNKIKIDELHFGDFIRDFDHYQNPGKNHFLDFISGIIPEEYLSIKDPLQAINSISETVFSDEFHWNGLDQQHKNLIYLYEHFVLGGNKQLRKEQVARNIALVYRDFLSLIKCNSKLTQFLVRTLKKLMYDERNLYLAEPDVVRETFFRVCEKQVLMILPVVRDWDWNPVVEKDTATILISAIEDYFERFRNVPKKISGDLKQCEFEAGRLIYYVFINLPSERILKEMASYSRDKTSSSFYSLYLDYFISGKAESFASPFNEQMDHFQFTDLGNFNQCVIENNDIKRVFKWKFYSEAIIARESWFFFINFTENNQFLNDLEQRSAARAEMIHNDLLYLLRECGYLVEEINILEKPGHKGYFVDSDPLQPEVFHKLPQKLQDLLDILGKIENFVISHFPLYERELMLQTSEAPGKQFGLNRLQQDCNMEREQLLHMQNDFENEKENSLLAGYGPETGKTRSETGRHIRFIKQWFFSRFAFILLLSPKTRIVAAKKKNSLLWREDTKNYFLRMVYNPLFTLIMLCLPFALFHFSKFCYPGHNSLGCRQYAVQE